MDIVTLIGAINSRPEMFLSKRSINDLDTFLRGYIYYRKSHEIEEDENDRTLEDFKCHWLPEKLGHPGTTMWIQKLLDASQNQEEAFEKFFLYWQEYLSELTLIE